MKLFWFCVDSLQAIFTLLKWFSCTNLGSCDPNHHFEHWIGSWNSSSITIWNRKTHQLSCVLPRCQWLWWWRWFRYQVSVYCVHWVWFCDVNCLYRHWSTRLWKSFRRDRAIGALCMCVVNVVIADFEIRKTIESFDFPYGFSLCRFAPVNSVCFLNLISSLPPFYLPHFRALPHHFRPFYDCFLLLYINIYIAKSKHKCASSNFLLKKNQNVDIDSLNFDAVQWSTRTFADTIRVSWCCRWCCCFYSFSVFIHPLEKLHREIEYRLKRHQYLFIRLFKDSIFFSFRFYSGEFLQQICWFFFRFHSGLSLNCLNWVVNDAMVYFSFAFIFEMLSKVVEIHFT